MRLGQGGKDVFKIGLPALLVLAAGFYVAFLFVAPAPPNHLTLATGGSNGAYQKFGEAYQRHLAEEGVRLDIQTTGGSIENLELLEEPDSGIDVAFVQGGIGKPEDHPDLISLAALYFEPVWVFTRGVERTTRLSALEGKRIATGAEGSGTREVALALLQANGLTEPPTRLLPLGGAEAAEALTSGSVDAAFFVAGTNSKLIAELLHAEGVHLMHFARAEGYAQARRSFSTVTLHAGVIDFAADIPPSDTWLLAPAATLVARSDLHPALVELLLRAATETHREGGLFEPAGTFPTLDYLDFPPSDEARRFLERGPSFLNRILPFWAANFVERTVVMLIPLLTLLLPLMRFLPPVYRWRIRSRIYRWYKELRAVDTATVLSLPAAEQSRLLGELARIEEEVKQVSVPLSHAEPLYHLRLHIELLRDKLQTVAAESAGSAESAAGSQT